MNHDEILKLRAERIKAFRQASGGGTSGVVPSGMASYLLAVSASRIKALLLSGRLETISQAGQRWILFASICKYAEANATSVKVSSPGVPKSDTSKPVMSKAKVPSSSVAKSVVTKKRVSQTGVANVGTI